MGNMGGPRSSQVGTGDMIKGFDDSTHDGRLVFGWVSHAWATMLGQVGTRKYELGEKKVLQFAN